MSAAGRFKAAIARQLAQCTPCSESLFQSLLRDSKKIKDGQFSLSIPKLMTAMGESQPTPWATAMADKFVPNDLIANATTQGSTVFFQVRPAEFAKQVLQQVHRDQSRYGWAHAPQPDNKPTVLIDYSSPNIAKPFHAGHLRSTILGNFIKRIHEAMGYNVVGINYLGDWGKQYGLLAVGFERYGSKEELDKDPIHHLYNVYVKINADAKTDPTIDAMANAYFARMEQGDPDVLSQWRQFRELSIASYASMYKRLGVSFDVYSGESEVNSIIPEVYKLLEEKNLLEHTPDGAAHVNLEAQQLGTPPVRRSDGTSLYLTRDLASLLLRQQRYPFDKAVYVVGVEQAGYFQQLFAIARLMLGSSLKAELQHASFGRIKGMSTRQGTAVFLQDLLDKAQAQILESIHTNADKMHALADADLDEIADHLGVSAILIQDMKGKRTKDYHFSWERMTDVRGDTGVFLQYAHARACGIERKANTLIDPHCDFTLLKEHEAMHLVKLISLFPETVDDAFETLEPSAIVNYLFKLSHATSQAHHTLRVKDTDPSLAQARMLLFWAARTTLANGLTLLGIRPVEYM